MLVWKNSRVYLIECQCEPEAHFSDYCLPFPVMPLKNNKIISSPEKSFHFLWGFFPPINKLRISIYVKKVQEIYMK